MASELIAISKIPRGPTTVHAARTNTLRYDSALCTGCGMCVSVCPHAVFVLDGAVAVLSDAEACMECGACKLNCPPGAIAVDSGVGCATAMIVSALTGRSESCSC
jgi:NAD-dependent dihydropyrimidine dehydrogenase PreA subunit